MDVNATLAELRGLAAAVLAGTADPDGRAEELFTALDEWVMRGGGLPSAWTAVGR